MHYMALVGALLLGLQLWTWIGWLIAGPQAITGYEDRDSASWYTARVLEVAMIVVFTVLLVYLVRKCRREHELVFEAKLFIAGAAVMWLDMWTNLLQPLFLYSSNWVNLNNPLTGLPFIPNPDPGSLPFPILFHAFNYPVALLVAGVLVSTVMGKLRARWPRMSNVQLLLLCALLGIVFDFAYEIPMFKLRVWAYPGTPDELALFSSNSTKFPIWEWIPAGIAFASFGALRYFKDDRGRQLTERGLEGHSPVVRQTLSVLALIAVVSGVWLWATTTQAIGGLYADPYQPLPAHLVNDVCDAPLLGGGQRTGTAYGHCPQEGSPIPVRKLPESADDGQDAGDDGSAGTARAP